MTKAHVIHRLRQTRHSTGRALLALLALAWSGLLLQPCAAAAPGTPSPGGMEGAQPCMPCPAHGQDGPAGRTTCMQAACVGSHGLPLANVTPVGHASQLPAVTLQTLPFPAYDTAPPRTSPATSPPARAAPLPLALRFCTLLI